MAGPRADAGVPPLPLSANEAEQKAKREAEREATRRLNNAYLEQVNAELAAQGRTIPNYFRRDDDPSRRNLDEDNNDQSQFFQLSSGERARDPMGPGIYHAVGKAPFDLVLDEHGKVTAIWAPRNERGSGLNSDSWWKFNYNEVTEAKMRAMIEFQLARGCDRITFDFDKVSDFDKDSIERFIKISKEYPVKIDFGKNIKSVVTARDPEPLLAQDDAPDPHGKHLKRSHLNQHDVADISGMMFKAKEESEIKYKTKIDPMMYGAKKSVDYAKDVSTLNANAKMGQDARNKMQQEFEAKSPEEKVTAAKAQIDDLAKRMDMLVTIKNNLDKHIEELIIAIPHARTKEEVNALRDKYNRVNDDRMKVLDAMKKEFTDLHDKRDMCNSMLANLNVPAVSEEIRKKAEELKAKIPSDDKMKEVGERPAPGAEVKVEFKTTKAQVEQQLQKRDTEIIQQRQQREQSQRSQRGPGRS